jgi:hypothetical protein
MDESSITTVCNKLPKMITGKGKRRLGKILFAGRGQLVTVVCCFSATGMFIPTTMILPHKECVMNCVLKFQLELYL